MVRTLRIGLRRSRYWFGGRGGDLAEDVVKPPALDLQPGNRPAAGAGESGDFARGGMSAPGETHEPAPRGSPSRLACRHSGQRCQLGPDIRVRAAGDVEANSVVMARALSELRRRPVGEDAAMSDDDCPVAYRL